MKTLNTKTLLLAALVVSTSPVVAMETVTRYATSAKDAVVAAASSVKKHTFDEPVSLNDGLAKVGLKVGQDNKTYYGMLSDKLDNVWVKRAAIASAAAGAVYGAYNLYNYLTAKEQEKTGSRGENQVAVDLKSANIESFKAINGLTAQENAKLASLSVQYAGVQGKFDKATKRSWKKQAANFAAQSEAILATWKKTVAELVAKYAKQDVTPVTEVKAPVVEVKEEVPAQGEEEQVEKTWADAAWDNKYPLAGAATIAGLIAVDRAGLVDVAGRLGAVKNYFFGAKVAVDSSKEAKEAVDSSKEAKEAADKRGDANRAKYLLAEKKAEGQKTNHARHRDAEAKAKQAREDEATPEAGQERAAALKKAQDAYRTGDRKAVAFDVV